MNYCPVVECEAINERGLTKGGLSSKLHAITDALGRLVRLFLSAGSLCNDKGVLVPLSSLPKVKGLLTVRGYDACQGRHPMGDPCGQDVEDPIWAMDFLLI